MNFFTVEHGKLIFENNGESLQIEGWGENSLRIRSRMMGEILDTDYALLPVNGDAEAAIEIDHEAQTATIQNGKIKAVVRHSWWDTPGRISFYNDKGELLLQEIGSGGALKLRSRAFKPIIGGDHQLTVSFAGNDGERIYGMGQYQQETFDLKGSTLELAHRNSQLFQQRVRFLMA